MKQVFKDLRLSVWDCWDDAFRKAKLKGETDGYAMFLANAWIDYRERNLGDLLQHPRVS